MTWEDFIVKAVLQLSASYYVRNPLATMGTDSDVPDDCEDTVEKLNPSQKILLDATMLSITLLNRGLLDDPVSPDNFKLVYNEEPELDTADKKPNLTVV